jgi:hypothetical protein
LDMRVTVESPVIVLRSLPVLVLRSLPVLVSVPGGVQSPVEVPRWS